MFSKISNKKDSDTQPKDENIRNEAKFQDEDRKSLLAAGNENMINIMNENNIMNDNSIMNESSDDPFHLNEFFAKKEAGQKNNNIDLNNLITNEISEKGMAEKDDSDSEDGSLIIDTRSDKKKEADRLKKLAAKKAPQVLNLINNIAAPQKQEGGNVPKKESKYEQDARLNGLPLFEGEIYSDADNYEAPEEDNIAVAPKKTRRKKSSKNKIPKPLKKSNVDLSEIDDLEEADEDMKNVGGWDFAAEKLADRKKAGSGSGFLTGMARFFGKTLGRVLNLIITPFSAFHLIRGGITSLGSKSDFQEKRTHDEIPGWNGRKYKQDPDGNANILADFRQVPTVWSKLTADNAADDKGNPLPPEVSINVSQPQEGVDQTMNGMDSGHSGMGIEYTRFSKATGRYERYRLRFGYYMAGGGTFSTMVMGSYKGAVTPGQLRDESSQQYTISRKFKANSKQVNAILQAARTYADKGYQPYTRNCTTFVRDMMQVGNIAGAKNVVDSVTPEVSNFGNLGIFGGEVVLSNSRAGQERNFAKLGRLNDQSYAGWGNKRVTKEDYRLYNESLKNGGGFSDGGVFADTPNSAAENLRRLDHDNAGDFGSFDYASPSLKTNPNNKDAVNMDWFALGRACGAEADNILQIIDSITPAEMKNKQTEEMMRIIMNLGNAGAAPGSVRSDL